MSFERNSCGLFGGAVVGLLCQQGMLVREGSFVVEAGDMLDEFCELGTIGGVSAVGVGTDRGGGSGQLVVGDEGAVFGGPVHTSFDVVDL